MRRGLLVGRLFGTDIFVTPDFFLLLAWYFLWGGSNAGRTALFCIAIIISLLVHEFGHVLAVRWLLRAPSAVVLWGLGGLCVYAKRPDTPGKQIGISLMGPALEAVLGLGCWLVFRYVDLPRGLFLEFLWMMVWINLFWVGANLLPILPLDGGQALRAAFEMRMGAGRAGGLARKVSVATALGAGALAITAGYLFAAILCAFLLFRNLRPE